MTIVIRFFKSYFIHVFFNRLLQVMHIDQLDMKLVIEMFVSSNISFEVDLPQLQQHHFMILKFVPEGT